MCRNRPADLPAPLHADQVPIAGDSGPGPESGSSEGQVPIQRAAVRMSVNGVEKRVMGRPDIETMARST